MNAVRATEGGISVVDVELRGVGQLLGMKATTTLQPALKQYWATGKGGNA